MADTSTAPAPPSPPVPFVAWLALGLSGLTLAGLIAHVLTTRSHPVQFGKVNARLDHLSARLDSLPTGYESFVMANALARSNRPGGSLLNEAEHDLLLPVMNRGYGALSGAPIGAPGARLWPKAVAEGR